VLFRVAVALSTCIGSVVSLLLIVHVITCAPSEQTVEPPAVAVCANAGIAVATTNNPANAATPAAATLRRRIEPRDRLLTRVLKGASQAMNDVR
jgi:hypothetical protein